MLILLNDLYTMQNWCKLVPPESVYSNIQMCQKVMQCIRIMQQLIENPSILCKIVKKLVKFKGKKSDNLIYCITPT